MEGIEEEQVSGEKGAQTAGTDQHNRGIPETFTAFRALPGHHRGEKDDHAKNNQHDAHAIVKPGGEVDVGLGKNRPFEGPDLTFPAEE